MIKFHIQANDKEYDADVTTADEILALQRELLENTPDEKELAEIGHGVKESIERNLFSATDFMGGAVVPLKESTIKRKGHSKVFFHTGELYRSVKDEMQSDGVEIAISDNREEIAGFLHYGTDDMASRPFFGILPERAEIIIQEVLSEKLKKLS